MTVYICDVDFALRQCWFVQVVVWFDEMCCLCFSFMLVGEPFGCKTSVIHTMAEAMTLLANKGDEEYSKVIYKTINPKAITMGQLYGNFDDVSHEVSQVCHHGTTVWTN